MTILRLIPKVDRVLEWQDVKDALAAHQRPLVLKVVRAVLESLRNQALHGVLSSEELEEKSVAGRIRAEIALLASRRLRRVVNGTGVVMHTNLGRSPLPEAVRDGLNEVAFAYSNLEMDLENGERGSRYAHVEGLICELTGAESALVVNNNAAAVLLALSSLAQGKEVVVSRGELVEIGGSFRIPEVMAQSGAILREVGTTNRTHPSDYSAAVNPETALFLKVHTSNFAVVGFTREVTLNELAVIGGAHSIPVMADAGSGNLLDLRKLGLSHEPTIREYLDSGVDVVTFSGDKLLGGPQAGIIAGRKGLLEPMKRHPLLRALRMDKLTLAALEGTLRLYRDERQAMESIPILKMLAASQSELKARALGFARRMRRQLPPSVRLSTLYGVSQAGGGALPLQQLPTTLISINIDGLSAVELERRLMGADIPVIGIIRNDAFLLDVRTLSAADLPPVVSALKSAAT